MHTHMHVKTVCMCVCVSICSKSLWTRNSRTDLTRHVWQRDRHSDANSLTLPTATLSSRPCLPISCAVTRSSQTMTTALWTSATGILAVVERRFAGWWRYERSVVFGRITWFQLHRTMVPALKIYRALDYYVEVTYLDLEAVYFRNRYYFFN